MAGTVFERDMRELEEANIKALRGHVEGKTIVFVTAGPPSKFFTMEIALRLGARVVVIDSADSVAALAGVTRGVVDMFIPIDFTRSHGEIYTDCYAAVAALPRVDAITTFCEVAVGLVSRLCLALGLPCHPREAVDAARDKYLTRQALERAGLPSPRNMLVTSADGIEAAAEFVGFPCVLKPVSGAASIGVVRADTLDELLDAFDACTHDLENARIVGGALELPGDATVASLAQASGSPVVPTSPAAASATTPTSPTAIPDAVARTHELSALGADGSAGRARSTSDAHRSRSSSDAAATPPVPAAPIAAAAAAAAAAGRPRGMSDPTRQRRVVRRGSTVASWMAATLMVEEYLDGEEVDVDVAMCDGEALYTRTTDNWPTHEPYFNETGSNAPSTLSAEAVAGLEELAIAASRALGLSTGVLHVELKHTSRGPRIVEINARMGGGPVRAINLLAWGVDLAAAHLALACGGKPALPASATARWHLAEFSVNAPLSGLLARVAFPGNVMDDPRVVYARPTCAPQTRVIGTDGSGLPTWVAEIMVAVPPPPPGGGEGETFDRTREAIAFVADVARSCVVTYADARAVAVGGDASGGPRSKLLKLDSPQRGGLGLGAEPTVQVEPPVDGAAA